MRTFFLVLAALLTLPALAQSGQLYENARFGYSLSVPDGFAGQDEAENGEGQQFVVPGRAIGLTVWGGLAGDFEQEVAAHLSQDTAAGWNRGDEAVTPRWASWSSSRGGQIAYQRMIALCDGQSYAAVRAEYGLRDRAEMDPLVEQLVASLRGGTC